MSIWASAKARKVLAALQAIGWKLSVSYDRTKPLTVQTIRNMSLHFTMARRLDPECWLESPDTLALNLVICDASRSQVTMPYI
jgi:hypothetical protein